MSTNRADIQVDVQTRELDRLNRGVDQLEGNIRGASREAKDSERSFRKLADNMDLAGNAANIASAAMDGIRAAAEVARRGFEIVAEAVRVFAEESEEGAAIVSTLETSFRGLQASLGQAVIATDGGREAVRLLVNLMGNLQDIVVNNADQIGDFASNTVSTFVSSIGAMGRAIIMVQEAFTGLQMIGNLAATGIGNSFTLVQLTFNSIAAGITGLLAALANGLALVLDGAELAARAIPGMGGLANQIGDAGRGLRGLGDDLENRMGRSVRAAAQNVETYRNSLAGLAQDTNDLITDSANFENGINNLVESLQNLGDPVEFFNRTGAGGGGGAGGGAGGEEESMNGVLATTVRLLGDVGTAALSSAAVLENEFVTANNYVTEQLRLAEEERLRIAEEAAAREAAIAEERAARQRRIGEEIGSQAVNLSNALISAEGKSAKQRRRILKQALGQEMVTKGQALLAEAVPTAIANPLRGALLAAAGTGLIAAGSKFGGGGGGGGRRGGGSATPRQAVSTQNVVFNQSTSFGFVGDRRAATREIEDINRASIDRGLRS